MEQVASVRNVRRRRATSDVQTLERRGEKCKVLLEGSRLVEMEAMISGSISNGRRARGEQGTREGPQGPAPRVRGIMESRQLRAYARSLFPRAALGFVPF